MSYATLQQLIDRFGERMLVGLTDRGEVPTGAIDQAVIDRALVDTSELITSYVRVRYQPLVAPFPPLLVDLALSVAIYKLHVYDPPTKIAEDYRLALATLRDLAAGRVRLDVAGAEPATGDGGGAMVTDRDRPMTADSLKGFI